MRVPLRPIAIFLALSSGLFASAPASPGRLLNSLPLRFEQDAHGRWTSRGAGYAIRFDERSTLLRVADRTLSLTLEGANSKAAFGAVGPSAVPSNYFIGHEYRSAPGFSRLRRSQIYPGIDVVYYGNGRNLEYDFELSPSADPSRIAMRFSGADSVHINNRGEIVLALGSDSKVVQQLPQVYQRRASGELVAVEASYRLRPGGAIGLSLGKYDSNQALVVDPTILLAAYLGGSYADAATAIGHDAAGFVYLGGYTYSLDFPENGQTVQPYPTAPSRDCWMMKLNPFASDPNNVIVYSTYFGGDLDDDLRGMSVDANGRVYLGGVTLSPDFKVTDNAYATTLPNTLAVNIGFGAVLDPSQPGSAGLIYSSYFGSASAAVEVTGVANFQGRVYLVGWTQADDLPMTSTSFQTTRSGGQDGFIAVLDPSQSGTAGLYYSTYLGGTQQDQPRSIDVDPSGLIAVTGLTLSPNFYTTANCLQPAYDVGGDAFLTLINPTTGSVPYSTFVGGSDLDVATKVIAEPSGRFALAGYTFSTDFYRTPNAAQPALKGNADAFITELDTTRPGLAALLYSTFYGGSDVEVAYDMRRDAHGVFYLAGYTMSPDLPVTNGAINPVSAAGGVDGFVAVIDPARSLVYSSYITSTGYQIAYAVDYDSAGNAYVAGLAAGEIFAGAPPKTNGASNYDGFIMVLSVTTPSAQRVHPTSRPKPLPYPRTGDPGNIR